MRRGLVRREVLRQGPHGTHRATYWVRADQPVSAFVRIKTTRDSLDARAAASVIKPTEHVRVSTSWFGNNNGHVKAGLESIGKVHGVPGSAPPVKVDVKVLDYGLWGYYKLGSERERQIAVNSYAPHARMTVVHEYGHFLDHQILGSGKPGLQGLATHSSNPEVKALMRVLVRTPEVQRLREKLRDPSTPEHHKSYLRYLLMPAEIFARSYSQHITRASKDVRMQHELNMVRRADREMFGYETQWSDRNFVAVNHEFEQLFRRRGLHVRAAT